MLKAAKMMAAVVAILAIIMTSGAAAFAAGPECGFPGGGSSSTESSGGSGGTESGGGEPGAEGSGGGTMGMMFPLILFGVIFYFFLIRPQKKRQKQQDNLISSVVKGDQIITIGGFYGTVHEVRDDSFVIELAKDVRVRLLKSAVSTKRLPVQSQASAQIEDK